jgi:tRNA threonylcarbamoyladenosine biosynthesis protein TsaE
MADTKRLGTALATVLPPGTVIALDGPLGSGKTALVRAIASSAGVPAEIVTSPTFVLINEYPSRLPIYHFDAYRLADEDEFLELGPDEYFFGRGWTFVEWASRVQRCLPRNYLAVRAESTGAEERTFHLQVVGEPHDLVDQIAAVLP